MGACRENANIWFWLSRYGIKEVMKRKVWTMHYFWHDSFGKYLWRIGCLVGHRYTQWIEDDNSNSERLHCFNCERDFESRYKAPPPWRRVDDALIDKPVSKD